MSKKIRKGRLLLFDTQFFRRLIQPTSLPQDSELRQWQHGYFEILKKEFSPYSIVVTPFLFFEMIGGKLPARSTLGKYPIPEIAKLLDGESAGQALVDQYHLIHDEIYNYYSTLECLSVPALRKMANEFLVTRVANNNYAKILAKDLIERFMRNENFEQTLCEYLTFDEMQHLLDAPPYNKITHLARVQFLNDWFVCFKNGVNLPIFRLMRGIWRSIEDELNRAGKGTLLPLKANRDLLDTEYATYVSTGAHQDGKLRTINVITCETLETVENRAAIITHIRDYFSKIVLRDKLYRENSSELIIRPGTIYVCDSKSPRIIKAIRLNGLDPDTILRPMLFGNVNEFENDNELVGNF